MRLGKQGISKHATCEQRNHGCKKCREKSTVHLMRAFTWLTQPELLTLLICFACKGFAGAAATRARPSKNCSRAFVFSPPVTQSHYCGTREARPPTITPARSAKKIAALSWLA